MKNHQTAIRAAFAGLLLATTLVGSRGHALVPNPPCVASAQQARRACRLDCVPAICNMAYRAWRAQCVTDTPQGPPRQECFAHCKAELATCQSGVRSCKAACDQQFRRDKQDCQM